MLYIFHQISMSIKSSAFNHIKIPHTQLNKIIISYEMIIKYNNGIVVFIFSNRRAGFKYNESHARVYFLYLPPHNNIVMNHSTAAMALRQHTI